MSGLILRFKIFELLGILSHPYLIDWRFYLQHFSKGPDDLLRDAWKGTDSQRSQEHLISVAYTLKGEHWVSPDKIDHSKAPFAEKTVFKVEKKFNLLISYN